MVNDTALFLALPRTSGSTLNRQQLDPTVAKLMEIIGDITPMTWVLITVALFGLFVLPRKTKILAAVAAVSLLVLPGPQAFLVMLLLLGALVAAVGISNVPEGTMGIAERFGRFHRTLDPGINFIIPGIDRLKDFSKAGKLYSYGPRQNKSGEPVVGKIPLYEEQYWLSTKEQLLDPIPKKVICNDNTEVVVDSIASFVILDPEKAVYGVDRLGDAMLSLMETSLRQEIGRLNADEVVTSRGPIGEGVEGIMESATESWGVRIVRVEIEDITFVEGVQDKLSAAREEELEGRALLAQSKRERDSEVTKAEGKKQARVLIAQGEFEAKKLQAEGEYLLELKKRQGEAEGLKAIAEALKDSPDAAVALEALKAQQSVARSLGEGTNTMILPAESAGLFGALGAIKQFKSFLDAKPRSTATESHDPPS